MPRTKEDPAKELLKHLADNLFARAIEFERASREPTKSPSERQVAMMASAVIVGITEALKTGLETIEKMEREGGPNG